MLLPCCPLQLAGKDVASNVIAFAQKTLKDGNEVLGGLHSRNEWEAEVEEGAPDLTADPAVQARKEHLIKEAQITLRAIQTLAKTSDADPLTDPSILARCVTEGILDAPQLINNPFALGNIQTQIIHGACQAIDAHGQALDETQRLHKFFS